MKLFEFLMSEAKMKIMNKVEHTGMSDSIRPSTLSFLDNPKFVKDINSNNNIVSVFVRKKDAHLIENRIEKLIVENPKAIFFEHHNKFYKDIKYPRSTIATNARIHPTAYIAPEGVRIEEGVVVGPNCTILSGVEIGKETTIGPNSVIGSEGFHVFADTKGIKRMAIHDGKVLIERYVDIQASVNIDKGLMGKDTIISDECKIDNAVHIAHRVFLDNRVTIAANACIAGTVNVGKNVWIGPSCVLSNRVSIGDNAEVLLGSVVIRNVKPGITVSGNFAQDHKKHLLRHC